MPKIGSIPQKRIGGGYIVPNGSAIFNFIVQVKTFVNETYIGYCGGSLISPNYVITAGHFMKIIF